MNHRRSSRRVHIASAIVFLGVPIAVACGGKIEEQNGSGGGSPSATTSSTATSSATTTPTSSATATATATATSSTTSPPLISCPGQPPASPAPCAVSFQETIFPYINDDWGCSNAGCHGTDGSGNSGQLPGMNAGDAKATYLSLAQYSLIASEPYVNACSTNPNQSAMLCNLEGTCGLAMPISGGSASQPIPPSETSIENLKTWLQCGAPFN